MADIVVCGDLEHEIEKTGELTKLQTLGSVEIINELDPTREFLIRRLRGARAVLEIRGRAALDEKTLAQLPELEMIATTGPHRIDIQAATSLGIVVATTPGVSTAAVADHVCALTLALARHIVSADNALRRRRWEPITGFTLEGKTFGILGLGRIGTPSPREYRLSGSISSPGGQRLPQSAPRRRTLGSSAKKNCFKIPIFCRSTCVTATCPTILSMPRVSRS